MLSFEDRIIYIDVPTDKMLCYNVKSDFEMFCLIVLNCQESRYSVLTNTPETWH